MNNPIFLLISAVICWGLNWPITKVALQYVSPIWFSFARVFGAAICCFLYLAFKKAIALPKKGDLVFILSIGIIQFALFLIFINIALVYESASRAVILCFCSPFLVMPLSAIFFHEKIHFLKTIGGFFGLAGIVTLLHPSSVDWSQKGVIAGDVLLLLSALCWAISILITRYGKRESPMPVLLAWQFLVGSLVCVPIALFLEPKPLLVQNTISWASTLYSAIPGTAYAYWAGQTATARLSASISSLALLGVPLCGVLASWIMINEVPGPSTLISLALLMIGLGLSAIGHSKTKA